MNEISGNSGKKSESNDKHEDPKKDDDHKSGSDKDQHTNDATSTSGGDQSVSHLISDAFGSAVDKTLSSIKGAWNYLSSTGAGTESLPNVQITDKNKQPGSTDASQTPGTQPAGSQDFFSFDTWWNKWRDTQKADAQKAGDNVPDDQKAALVGQYVASDRGWNRITNPASYESHNPHGGTDRTTISNKGTDHEMADGSRGHTDARGTVITEKNGMVVASDAATGQTREKMPNGTDIIHNKDGSFDVTRDGVKVHINKDGTIDQEVNGHHVKVDKDRVDTIVGRYHFIQDRGHKPPEEAWKDAHGKTEDGKPAVYAVRDPENRGRIVMVVNDGKGNTVDYYKNSDVVIRSAEHPETELITNQREHTMRIRANGQEYWLQRQQGTDGADRWYLYDNKDGKGNPTGWIDGSGSIYRYDANDPTQNGGKIGQLSKPVADDGTLRQGTATAGTDAAPTLIGDAKGVKVDQQGDGTTTATAKEGDDEVSMRVPADGETSEVTTRNRRKGTSDATVTNATDGSYQTKKDVQVDEHGNAVLDENGKIQGGSTITESTGIDAQGHDHTRVGLGEQDGKEQFLEEQYNENGEPSWHNTWDNSYWDEQGNLWDSQGNMLRDDGSVLYSDGTEVDPDGRVSYLGDEIYDAQDEWDDGGASVAQVNAIIGLAASISASGIADPGKVGQLLSLYAQLGNVAGKALQAGDIGAFMQADLAKAVVSGAISQQQAAEARTVMAQYFTNHPLNMDEIHQLQHKMSGTSAAEVQEFVKRSGWTNDAATRS